MDLVKTLSALDKPLASRDEVIWKRWVDFQDRDWDDLIRLLSSDVKDEFKKRAIFLLLVPAKGFSHTYWLNYGWKFYHGFGFLRTLSQELLVFASGLMAEFFMASKSMKDKDIAKHMLTKGALQDALVFYNNSMLILLKLLPDDQAERVFPLYSLQSVSKFINHGGTHSFRPFIELMSSEIGEKWKRAADAEMRNVVQGGTEELALQDYVSVVQIRSENYSKYSLELLEDQVKFLLSRYPERIKVWTGGDSLFYFLGGEAEKELRRRVAKLALLGQPRKMISGEPLKIASRVLKEFESDQELADELRILIRESEEELAERVAGEIEKANDEKKILAQMR